VTEPEKLERRVQLICGDDERYIDTEEGQQKLRFFFLYYFFLLEAFIGIGAF
jgi:hypothetical protein